MNWVSLHKTVFGMGETQAKVRDIEQRLYTKKSETSGTTKNEANGRGGSARPEASSRGDQGMDGRTTRPHLPVTAEERDVDSEHKHCPKCRKPHVPFGSEGSDIIEVQVRPFTRRIKRCLIA